MSIMQTTIRLLIVVYIVLGRYLAYDEQERNRECRMAIRTHSCGRMRTIDSWKIDRRWNDCAGILIAIQSSGVEKGTAMHHTIQAAIFAPRQCIAWKREIPITEIADKAMYEEGGRKLSGYIGGSGLRPTGAWSVIYFAWDEPKGRPRSRLPYPLRRYRV
jgi:hypothetical protein